MLAVRASLYITNHLRFIAVLTCYNTSCELLKLRYRMDRRFSAHFTVLKLHYLLPFKWIVFQATDGIHASLQ